MTTNRFIIPSSDAQALSGDYNHNPGQMYIPEEASTISTAATYVGEMRYVSSSGVFAVWSGSEWTVHQLSGLASGQPPTSISGLVAWYDAATSDTSLTGSGVDTWNDKSGNDYHLNNNDGPPNIGDDGGVSGMELNGTSDMFIPTSTHPAIDCGGDDQAFTVIVAYRSTRTGTAAGLFSFADAATNVSNIFGNISASEEYQFFKRDPSSNTASIVTGIADHTVPQVTTWLHSGTGVSIYGSGTAITASEQSADVNDTTDLTLTGFGGLNRFGFGKSLHFQGWIYSIAVWNRKLTTQERWDVERNFATRYNVTMGTYEVNQ